MVKRIAQRTSIEELISEGKICRDYEHGMKIESCNAYGMNFCPMICSYSKQMDINNHTNKNNNRKS